MFRMTGTIYKDGKAVRRATSRQEDADTTRTTRVLAALREICEYMDLALPIWLDKNIREFQRKGKTAFRQDAFVEPVGFDSFTIEIIEE